MGPLSRYLHTVELGRSHDALRLRLEHGRTAFVSSANFTEAAQERSIEVGALVRSPIVAERLTNFLMA